MEWKQLAIRSLLTDGPGSTTMASSLLHDNKILVITFALKHHHTKLNLEIDAIEGGVRATSLLFVLGFGIGIGSVVLYKLYRRISGCCQRPPRPLRPPPPPDKQQEQDKQETSDYYEESSASTTSSCASPHHSHHSHHSHNHQHHRRNPLVHSETCNDLWLTGASSSDPSSSSRPYHPSNTYLFHSHSVDLGESLSAIPSPGSGMFGGSEIGEDTFESMDKLLEELHTLQEDMSGMDQTVKALIPAKSQIRAEYNFHLFHDDSEIDVSGSSPNYGSSRASSIAPCEELKWDYQSDLVEASDMKFVAKRPHFCAEDIPERIREEDVMNLDLTGSEILNPTTGSSCMNCDKRDNVIAASNKTVLPVPVPVKETAEIQTQTEGVGMMFLSGLEPRRDSGFEPRESGSMSPPTPLVPSPMDMSPLSPMDQATMSPSSPSPGDFSSTWQQGSILQQSYEANNRPRIDDIADIADSSNNVSNNSSNIRSNSSHNHSSNKSSEQHLDNMNGNRAMEDSSRYTGGYPLQKGNTTDQGFGALKNRFGDMTDHRIGGDGAEGEGSVCITRYVDKSSHLTHEMRKGYNMLGPLLGSESMYRVDGGMLPAALFSTLIHHAHGLYPNLVCALQRLQMLLPNGYLENWDSPNNCNNKNVGEMLVQCVTALFKKVELLNTISTPSGRLPHLTDGLTELVEAVKVIMFTHQAAPLYCSHMDMHTFLKERINGWTSSAALNEKELSLLGLSLGVQLEVIWPAEYGETSFIRHYPQQVAKGVPKIRLVAESDKIVHVLCMA